MIELNEADLINMGDFNILVDGIGCNDAQNLLRLLNNFSLVKFVNKLTYNSGHILDFFVTKNSHSHVRISTVDTINTLSDRKKVNFHLNFNYAKVKQNS